MQLLQIHGGKPLHGHVTLSGSKHSALAILGVAPVAKGRIELRNFPELSDTHHMVKIIESFGVNYSQNETCIELEIGNILYNEEELWRISKLRSSILFLGSMLVRTRAVSLPIPGGDKLGNRPVDEFLYILHQFGIEYHLYGDSIRAMLYNRLKGHREIDLCSNDFPEMGNNRTVIALIFAWANRGRTILKNSIVLPEIIEVCHFLEAVSGGYVTIDGVGSDMLVINSPGIDAIHTNDVKVVHLIGPDKCEYSFWIAAASLTHGDIVLYVPYGSRDFRNLMRWLRAKLLRPAHIKMDILGYSLYHIKCSGKRTRAFDLKSTAHELYGIAFDATPLFATMLLNACGKGSYYCFKFKHERVKWIRGLEQIGAQYAIQPNGTLTVEGVEQLHTPKPVCLKGGDIRGASCVLLASLAVSGEPIYFQGLEHIQRGMEKTLEKLVALGANIKMMNSTEGGKK
ncbi:MAG: hypothetical protein ACFFCW_43760 [Candidatus Hodarchaeota archaeon]